jgi:hypothetical protein
MLLLILGSHINKKKEEREKRKKKLELVEKDQNIQDWKI